MIISLEEWIKNGKPRSYKHNSISITTYCKECNAEVIRKPSELNKKNIDRLFCSLGCSTRYRNLNDGVPAQKEGWRDKWYKTIKDNNNLLIGSKNPQWIEDRDYICNLRKKCVNYNQALSYVLKKVKTNKGLETFYIKHKYTIQELKTHLENLFVDGMTWENYGEWEIDHIIPIMSFLDNNIYDYQLINALINLQPLWRKDNRRKATYFVKQK